MISEPTQPTHEVRNSNEDPKEYPLQSNIHGEAVPPPPSGCDTPSERNNGTTDDVAVKIDICFFGD